MIILYDNLLLHRVHTQALMVIVKVALDACVWSRRMLFRCRPLADYLCLKKNRTTILSHQWRLGTVEDSPRNVRW